MKNTMAKIFMIGTLALYLAFLFCFKANQFMQRPQFEFASTAEFFERMANFIPFRNITFYIKSIFDGQVNPSTIFLNLVGNLAVTIPLGVYLPFFFPKLRSLKRLVLLVAAVILFKECLELFFVMGFFDLDDIILNTLGAVIGYGLWRAKPVQKLLLAR